MKSAVENLNPTRVKLTVEVPYEELEPSLAAAYKTIGAQVTVPGFRKGHVPPRIIDQRFGRGAVVEEAVNDAVPRFYAQAVEESEVRPMGRPQVEVNEVPAGSSGDLKFTAEVDVRPHIVPPDLDGIAVVVDDVTVSDEDVDTRVENLQERFGTLIAAERPCADGDFVTIDIAATIGGEEIDSVNGVSYQIGTGTMLDGLDEALPGLSAGETTTFDAPLAGGDHAGQSAHVTVVLQAVKDRSLPALDDDFAQLASEFDTLDELREDLRAKAATAKTYEQGLQARDRLIEALLAAVEVPVPEGLIADEVNRHLEGEGRQEDDEHRAEVEVEARKSFQAQLLLDAIAEQEKISVSQTELIEYVVGSAQQYGMEVNEFVKAVEENGQVAAMVGEVARQKALMAALLKATVTDVSGNPVDVDALIGRALGGADADDLDEMDADDLDDLLDGDDLADEDDDEGVDAAANAVMAGSPLVPVAADPTALPVSDLGGFEPDDVQR